MEKSVLERETYAQMIEISWSELRAYQVEEPENQIFFTPIPDPPGIWSLTRFFPSSVSNLAAQWGVS